MQSDARYLKYSIRPHQVSRESLLGNGFRLAPSAQRKLVSLAGSPLKNQVDHIFNGKELGSAAYVKTSSSRFIRTGSITSKILADCSDVVYCKPNSTVVLQGNEILIAEDGGGAGLGESCIYTKSDEFTDHLCNGALAIVVKDEVQRSFVLGFLKSSYFKEYLDNCTPVASTLRHSNGAAKDFIFPEFDSKNNIHVLLANLVKNWIDKESQILKKNKLIDSVISDALGIGQHGQVSASRNLLVDNDFRFAAARYSQAYLDVHESVSSYPGGCYFLTSKYSYKRGQSLEVGTMGASKYLSCKMPGAFALFRGTSLSDNRAVSGLEWLGTRNLNPVLVEPDSILLTATGTVGKCIFVPKLSEPLISNYNSWNIYSRGHVPQYESIFLACYLQWLRNVGYYETIQNPSNGGYIVGTHLDSIPIPNLTEATKCEIADSYFNDVEKRHSTLADYLSGELARNVNLGIWQLNAECFELRAKIDKLVEKLVFNRKVHIPFYLN